MQKIITFLVLSLLALSAGAAAQDYIPDELRGWQKWVLKDREYRDCPFYFNRGAADRDDFLCAWPGALKLDATAADGRAVFAAVDGARQRPMGVPAGQFRALAGSRFG